jgi:hypothetical protein
MRWSLEGRQFWGRAAGGLLFGLCGCMELSPRVGSGRMVGSGARMASMGLNWLEWRVSKVSIISGQPVV